MSGLCVKALKLLLSLCLLAVAGTIPAAHGSGDVTVVVKEGSDAVLPCSLSSKESISAKIFDWMKSAQKDDGQKEVFYYDAGIHYNNGRSGQSEEFKGRVSHFPGELKYGNASIIIRNTKIADSGNYTCVFPRLQPRQTFPIELVVESILKDRSGENSGASPKPSIRMLNATEDWVLQCEVQGVSPEPHLHWQDSAGNKLDAEELQVSEREGRYNITLNTRVTKSDLYCCVVTQEQINHQTHEDTFVFVRERACEVSSTEVAVACLCGVLGAAALAVLVALFHIKMRHNRGPHRKANSSCIQEIGSCQDPTELHLKSPNVPMLHVSE